MSAVVSGASAIILVNSFRDSAVSMNAADIVRSLARQYSRQAFS